MTTQTMYCLGTGNMGEALGYGRAALFGAAIMGAFAWLPVLYTAWKQRHAYPRERANNVEAE